MNEKRRYLGLDPKHTGLIILDEFKWQTTEKVLKLLGANDLMYVIVPPNCTDRLQPFDVSTELPDSSLKPSLRIGMPTKLLHKRIWQKKLS